MTSDRDAGGGRPTTVRPSTVRLPEHAPDGVRTVFDFFVRRFPRISPDTWRDRFAAGKVWADDGALTLTSPYQALLEVHYRREVEAEPPVRTDIRVVWRDDHLLVVDKPPHLPVIPGGRWVRNCLLHLLCDRTEDAHLAPLHRLDRLTSGLVVFSRDPASRGQYAQLFAPGAPTEKTYTAVCEIEGTPPAGRFTLADHITRCYKEYWRQVVLPDRPVNALAEVEMVASADRLALLRVRLITGRKHQIRVQLAHAGMPVLGDPLYGSTPSYDPGDLSSRLWLDAHRLVVKDFRLPGPGPALNADWRSSRDPMELLRRAADRT